MNIQFQGLKTNNLKRQRGVSAILIALSMTVMIGLAGLALDLGRLYVRKSELQGAADSCALGASTELKCDTSITGGCPSSYLENAEIKGRFMAAKNKDNFQLTGVTLAADDVKFSIALNGGYYPRTSGSITNNEKFVKCEAKATGIVPWFLGYLGIGQQAITASAVGTLSPSAGFCNGPPLALCSAGPGTDFGFSKGEWLRSAFSNGNSNDGLTGNFKWVDFTPSAGGTNELSDKLVGKGTTCNIKVGDDISQPGGHQGAKFAYNTRFGIYKNTPGSYTYLDAPPDRTGYAYPNQTPGGPIIDQSLPPGTGPGAYANYRLRQNANQPFTKAEYFDGSVVQGNVNESTITVHNEFGSERRLAAVPVIDCAGGSKILGMACILMLNPMSNGSGTIYLEYRGNASAAGSPCASSGMVSLGGNGPLVPTLVQ